MFDTLSFHNGRFVTNRHDAEWKRNAAETRGSLMQDRSSAFLCYNKRETFFDLATLRMELSPELRGMQISTINPP